MKKLLIILLFSSCGYAPIDMRGKAFITKIQTISGDQNYCYYYGFTEYCVFTANSEFVVVDSVDKYKLGDVIKLTK